MVQMAQLWLTHNGIDTTRFDLIATPFDANGTGLDHVLNQTTVNAATGHVTISDGTTTQNSTITYPTPGTITVNTTTTNPPGRPSVPFPPWCRRRARSRPLSMPSRL